MDTAFQEESTALAQTEKKLQNEVKQLQQSERKQKSVIANFCVADHADIGERSDLQVQLDRTQQEIAKYKGVIPSPYFGRMDMDCSAEAEPMSIYIGKSAVSIQHEYIVFDWRSPLGQCFYMKSEKQFSVNDYHYQLLLRRALEVKGAKLIGCETEFDADAVSLKGEIVDPFLLTVLKDKRRQNRLTDIIKTIQETQNVIIRKPLEENFVLQGCAGSGKTMILLHRLSYIKFNHRDMSFDRTKIITPNPYFNAHINDLSEELGLHEIPRMPIEAYYTSLLKKYDRKADFKPSAHSETELPNELLQQIYSVDFIEKAAKHYHVYWEETLAQLHATSFEASAQLYGLAMPDEKVHKGETVVAFQAALDSIARQLSTVDDAVRQAERRIASIDKQSVELEKDLAIAETEWHAAKAQAKQVAAASLAEIKSEKSKCSADIEELGAKAQKTESEITQITDLIQRAEIQLAAIKKQQLIYTDVEQVTKLGDPLAKEILEANASNLNTIRMAQESLKRVAFYSFGKKNDLKQRITLATEVFTATAQTVLDKHLQEDQKKLEDAKQYHEFLLQTNHTLQAGLSERTAALHSAEKQAEQMQRALDALINEDASSESHLMEMVDSGVLDGKFASVLDVNKNRASTEKKMRDLAENKKELQAELIPLREKMLSTQQKADLARCREILDHLSLNRMIREVLLKELRDLFQTCGVRYPREEYRFHLYLYLQYYYLYFGRITGPDSFLCIDEAQDLSVTEYQLLRNVLGERCVFNLYGDVNQQIYRYKGIDDWAELSNIIGNKLYFLNENYRNALQITEFCNKEFEADVQPIGITSREVQELNLTSAIQWLKQLKGDNPQIRATVICKLGNQKMQQKLHDCLSGDSASWNVIDDTKISIVSVEMVKGLEFDAVVAIVEGMSVNEKYVAYTRALDDLVVVRDVFSIEQKESNPAGEDAELAAEVPKTESGEATPEINRVDFSPIEELQSVLRDLKAVGLPSMEEISAQTQPSPVASQPSADLLAVEADVSESKPVSTVNVQPDARKLTAAEIKRQQEELRERKIADFGEWMLHVKKLSPRTTDTYKKAIYFCDDFSKKHHVYKGSIVDYATVTQAREIILLLLNTPQMFKENKRGHSMYSAALNKYLGYLDASNMPDVQPAEDLLQAQESERESSLKALPVQPETSNSAEPSVLPEPQKAEMQESTAEDSPSAKDTAEAAHVEAERQEPAAERDIAPAIEAVLPDEQVFAPVRVPADKPLAPAAAVEIPSAPTIVDTPNERKDPSSAPESEPTVKIEPESAVEPAPTHKESELALALAEAKFKPLLHLLAADGITTLEDFRSTNVLMYINHCRDYSLQERIQIWDEIKPIWKRPDVEKQVAPSHTQIKAVTETRRETVSSQSLPLDTAIEPAVCCDMEKPRTYEQRRPESFALCGNHQFVDSWQGLIVAVSNLLARDYPKVFKHYCNRSILPNDSHPLLNSFAVHADCVRLDNGIFLYAPEDPYEILSCCYALCIICGIHSSAFHVYTVEQTVQPQYAQLSMIEPKEEEDASQETLSAPNLTRIEEYIKSKGLDGSSAGDVAGALRLKLSTVNDVLNKVPYVEIRAHVFLHESVLVDLEEASETLEAILQKQFQRFYGYTTSKKLFEAARIDLSMFMNDNGLSTEEEIYALAEYLFAKKCSNGIRHYFFGNLHIWETEPDYPKSTFGVLQNLARNKELVLKRDDIENYMLLVGLVAPGYKQAMQIGVKSTFLQYEAESVILTERLPAAADHFAEVGQALDMLFASEHVEYVILRDIHADWYTHQLPLLPGGLVWTPLLLQEVIKYFLAEKYITVKQSDGMALDTVQAAIVPTGGPLVTWGDIVYAYWMQDPDHKQTYSCEEFRQYLCAAKMLQGNELRNSLPRALDDARFSWDTARENVRIVGG